LEVLDDFTGEAEEVYQFNPWLNYALPLHRMREMGFNHKLFDLLDERPFTKDELLDFFYLLFGQDSLDSIPDPQVDWKGFANHVERMVNKESEQWNPIRKRMMPLINMKKLSRVYGNPSCASSILRVFQ